LPVRAGRVGQPRDRGRGRDAARDGGRDRHRSRQADRGVAHGVGVRRSRAAVEVLEGAPRQASARAPARGDGKLVMSDSEIVVEDKGTTVWVTLNRPDVRNALSRAVNLRLQDLAAELEHREEVQAIVLTGAGDK